MAHVFVCEMLQTFHAIWALFFFSILLFLVVLNGLLLRTVEAMFHVLFVSELGVNLQCHKLLFSMDMAVLFPDSVTFTIL